MKKTNIGRKMRRMKMFRNYNNKNQILIIESDFHAAALLFCMCVCVCAFMY
jgi:hypothetical protein